MRELEATITLADDLEIGDAEPVTMSLGEFRALLKTFRRLDGICRAMANGAQQLSSSAAEFAKFCDGLVPK